MAEFPYHPVFDCKTHSPIAVLNIPFVAQVFTIFLIRAPLPRRVFPSSRVLPLHLPIDTPFTRISPLLESLHPVPVQRRVFPTVVPLAREDPPT